MIDRVYDRFVALFGGALAGGAFMALNGLLAAVIYPVVGADVFWLGGGGFRVIGLIATLALSLLWRGEPALFEADD